MYGKSPGETFLIVQAKLGQAKGIDFEDVVSI